MHKIDLEAERKKLDRDITFFHEKRAKARIKKCLRLARISKDSFFFNYFSAQAEIIKEKFSEALRYLDHALALRPNDGCTYNDKALMFAEMEKYKEALECFNEGIKRDRDCASLYHNKGWLLHCLKRYPEALVCFQKALELEEDRVESIFSLADTYVCLGNEKKAKAYFEKALGCLKGKCGFMYREAQRRLRPCAE